MSIIEKRRTYRYAKWVLCLLTASLLILTYFLDNTDDFFNNIAPPNDVRAVDIQLDDSLVLPRSGNNLTHIEAFVMIEDGRILFEQNRQVLPPCPKDVKLNMDNQMLDKIRYCSSIDWKKSLLPAELVVWKYTSRYLCEGKLTIYDKEVALLRDVIVDNAFCTGRPCHEDVNIYLGSGFEKTDKLELEEGYFLIPCNRLMEKNKLFFRGGERNHLSQWVNALDSYSYPQYIYVQNVVKKFTIAIKRYEYWNLYHTISDIYNAYMATQYFNMSPDDVGVLFLDGGGSGPFIPLWENLFGKVTKLNQLSEQTLYRQLFWNKLGYNSEFLAHSNAGLPLVENFKKFVLKNFLLEEEKRLKCDNLTLLMISRNDYDNRTISRKIANQEEIVQALRDKFKVAKTILAELNLFPIKKQLHFINNADVLIGMHGAGMTHALFLPSHAGVVEFLPDWTRSDGHFRGISRWRNLKYASWRNSTSVNLNNEETSAVIPVDIAVKLISNMISQLCPQASLN